MLKKSITLSVALLVLPAVAIAAVVSSDSDDENFEEGALSFDRSTSVSEPGPYTIVAEQSDNRLIFRAPDLPYAGSGRLARTNGAGDNGQLLGDGVEGNRGLNNFKRNDWQFTVPFAVGQYFTRINNQSGTPVLRLYTPRFNSGSVKGFYSDIFTPETATGTRITKECTDLTGPNNYSARQNVPSNTPDRIILEKNGVQIGRTNGQGDNGNLLGFTTILVRTGSTIEDGRVVNKNECVPFALVDRSTNSRTPELRVITDAPGSNIGTNTVLTLDLADKPTIYQ